MPLLRQLLHHREHLADEFRIERAGRLVEQHQLRLHRQRTRNRHALLLAAGELRGIRIGLVRKPDAPQQSMRLGAHLVGLRAAAPAPDLR